MRLCTVLLLAFFPLALGRAQKPAPELSLIAAVQLNWALSSQRQSTLRVLQAAKMQGVRVAADPSSLRAARLSAAHELANQQAALRALRIQEAADTADAYGGLKLALERQKITAVQAEIAAQEAAAATLREEAGEISEAALQAARARAQSQMWAAEDAAVRLAEARRTLQQRLGKVPELAATLPAVRPVPGALPAALRGIDVSAVRGARQAIDIARAAFDAVNNPYSSRAERQEKRQALHLAQEALSRARTEAFKTLAQHQRNLAHARRALSSAVRQQGVAAQTLSAERARFKLGAGSSLSLKEKTLALLNAGSAVTQAQLDTLKSASALAEFLGHPTGLLPWDAPLAFAAAPKAPRQRLPLTALQHRQLIQHRPQRAPSHLKEILGEQR